LVKQQHVFKKTAVLFSAAVFSLLVFYGCKEDVVIGDLPPDTHISIEKIDLQGENRLNSSVYLTWFGTDKDGYVVGYEYSIDEIPLTLTFLFVPMTTAVLLTQVQHF